MRFVPFVLRSKTFIRSLWNICRYMGAKFNFKHYTNLADHENLVVVLGVLARTVVQVFRRRHEDEAEIKDYSIDTI